MNNVKTISYSFVRDNGRLSCFTSNGKCGFEDGQQIIMRYLINEGNKGSKITVERGGEEGYYTYAYEIKKALGDNEMVKTRFLIDVDESIKSHPAFIHFNTFLKKFYQESKRKEIEERNRIKKLKFGTAVGAIAVGIVLITTMPSTIRNISNYVDVQKYNATSVGLLDRDLQIHAGAYSIDGKAVSPYLDHGCVLGSEYIGSVENRIRIYCAQNNIDKRIEDAAVKKYQLLYENKKEGFNIDLRALVKEIEKETPNQEGSLSIEDDITGSKRR